MPRSSLPDGSAPGHLLRRLCLLWLTGMAMRMPILAVPPVITFIHEDLGMSETGVGLLMGLPLVLFAVAAIPGSLMIARVGTAATLVIGMTIAGLASAGRGGADNVAILYLATVVMGFGIAIMQPALPSLVREWLPERVPLGTTASTNGMLVGVALPTSLTLPVVLPWVDQSWRLDFVVWAAPVLVTALLFVAFGPRTRAPGKGRAEVAPAWLPDWRSPLTWLLGLGFGVNNSVYFTSNAFLPEYLASRGLHDLIGPSLAWLNGAQLLASFVLIPVAKWVLGRAWPYLVFVPLSLLALFGIILLDGIWIVVAAGVVGFSMSVTFVMLLAAPPILSPPGQVHRVAAGMFTIAYACGVLVPTISGGLWDLSGLPWTAFIPVWVCAVILVVFGVALSRYRPARG
ncbi:MAG TPA: MFS transporter [Xanthobacteraceae bacterium]|nr:MFS transporter [Xanthobacteraceae bacterium]